MDDKAETIADNPQSWIAWKIYAQQLEIALGTIRNMTDGHPIHADRRDRIFQLANEALTKRP